ncbi:uncharacterized protein ACNS7B_020502 [Menidia menidia]
MRRVRRKGGNKEKVFGCDLLEHLTTSSLEIPLVLRCCSEFVEQNGIVDGIYRLSGVSSNIQKLRGEFESDGSPDLNKDVYLQDIHCVSSLCKAYFRELPNPLLTYQLYDKFAEAVAIQLEEERLVKIKDVLKELPAPHYRTLEFLMRHLVKMASFSSETNMHARNLAIVWAPNLLRSKDIEASGFNGTAAFMEVRVQSIVVEFILTHVPQLFPLEGVPTERRKSLPSPSAMPNQEEGFFRSVQPNFGNISPGDGPLPIRPYHAIIEGTDKRKGSLKGRKWMSIFNIGVRIQDQRRRHKHSSKEKEKTALRPARSMDSLSTPPYPNEGTRHSSQRPPSTHMSPLVTSSHPPAPDAPAPAAGLGASEYAVTYRRGTGLVSGGAGVQGTYTALDPDGLGLPSNEGVQSRSPGLNSKAGRRAAMHITGPTLVTVPLHITSNLALGVLQGGGGDRVIQRGRDKDAGDKVEGRDGGGRTERKECQGMEWQVEDSPKGEEALVRNQETEDPEGGKSEAGAVTEEKADGAEEEEDEEKKRDCEQKQESVNEGGSVSGQQRTTSSSSHTEGGKDGEAAHEDQEDNNDYMEMKGGMQTDQQSASEPQRGNDGAFDASDILNSTEVGGDDQGLSGYVQDNFDFLDQMDCSVLDHLDSSVPFQVNEFSVEPPGHSDDEYEIMEQAQASQRPAGPRRCPQPGAATPSEALLKPHRPLSLDLHNRHTKSLSLPYMTPPVHGPEGCCSEESLSEDDNDDEEEDDDNLYDSEEDESMFVKSLPPDFFLNNLSGLGLGASTPPRPDPDRCPPPSEAQTPEGNNGLPLKLELSAQKGATSGDEKQEEVEGGEEEGRKTAKKKEDDEGEQPEDKLQSGATDEHLNSLKDAETQNSDPPTALSVESSPTSSEELGEPNAGLETEDEDVKGMVGFPPPYVADVQLEESRETSVVPGPPRVSVSCCETEEDHTCQLSAQEITDSSEVLVEELAAGGGERESDRDEEGGKEQHGSVGAESDIWGELEEMVCDAIEHKERELSEVEAKAEPAQVEGGQPAGASGGETEEAGACETNEAQVSAEGEEEEEESLQAPAEELPDPVKEEEDDEAGSAAMGELEKATQEKRVANEEARPDDGEEAVSKEPEKEKGDSEKDDERSSLGQPGLDKQPPVVVPESKESKTSESSDGGSEGVGRKLVVSRQPRVYQVKAVPVVPPKPQHCRMTALTLRQQQQQRDRREDGERLTLLRDRDRRRDGAEGAPANRHSAHSMCFDEAVAIATLRREKERAQGEADAEGCGK